MGQHNLHLLQVIAEVCICQPGDSVDSNHCHHTALPYCSTDRLLWLRLAEHYVCGSGREHNDLDDYVHLRDAHMLGQSDAFPVLVHVNHLAESEEHDHQQRSQEHVNRSLGALADCLVQGSGAAAIHELECLGIGLSPQEIRILVQVFSSAI